MGSKASNIINAGTPVRHERQGFSNPEIGRICTNCRCRCIIHWNFNHFVVLEGIDRRRASINDPAIGRRRLDFAELDRAFTGVALTIEPGADFKKIGSRPKGLRLLLRRTARLARGRRAGDRGEPRAHRAGHRHSRIFQDLRR